MLLVGSTNGAAKVDPGPRLAKVVASAGYFGAGGIVALAGSGAGMASAVAGVAFLGRGFASLFASLVVWAHGAHATAGRVFAAVGIASAAISGLLGFTEGGEIAFGANALFGVAALGAALDMRSVRQVRIPCMP